MKSSHFRLPLFAAALVTLGATALAQTTATTDPVGFITLNVAGTGGTTASAITMHGLGMSRSVEYQGSAETVGSNTLTDNEATWADNQFNGATNGAHYVEITSGAGAGTTYDIQSTSAATKTLTLSQNLGASVANGVTFKVRKHWTLASVFGPNAGTNNQVLLTGGTGTTADHVLLWNGTGYDTYYYQLSGIGGTGWRKAGAPTVPQDSFIIYPEDGVTIKRKQSAAVPVVLMGGVKMGQTSVPIISGISLVGNVYASNMTLASSGLYTGSSATGVAGGTGTTADHVLLWNGTGYDTYYYQLSGIGGTGWRKAGAPTVSADSTPIALGSAVTIKRKGATGFDWVIPQHPTTL